MEGSILESMGLEIIPVLSPVSICMLLVVLLISTLSSPTATTTTTLRTAANLVYLETPSDSTAQKLEGSLLNALVFVLLVAAVTFVLVLLYYYNFTNFLKNYMRFSAFFVFATMGGPIFLSIVQKYSIPFDGITCFVALFNFTVVGVLSVFSGAVPIVVRQGYTVCLGVIVAAWFTKLPEWTTWTLLIALAIYDLVAVLAPGGPLKILVELASSRDDELPALVYEARPARASVSPLGLLVGMAHSDVEESEMSALVQTETTSPGFFVSTGGGTFHSHSDIELQPLPRNIDVEESEMSPLSPQPQRQSQSETMSRGIKLGLGDFVFYSVLVGRAAMYDLMTVYACYFAIISGLACTLILLAVCRHALPALPISIALGIMFYFLTRLLMEPFVVGASTNLIMF